MTKKAKKAMQKHATTAYGTTPTDVNDLAALHRRAQRFQREHELEKNKNIRNGGQTFLKTNYQTVNRFQNLALVSRSASPTDEPEGDPVSPFVFGLFLADYSKNVIDWDRFTIVGTSQELFKDYLRLTSVSVSFSAAVHLNIVMISRNQNLRPYVRIQSFRKLL